MYKAGMRSVLMCIIFPLFLLVYLTFFYIVLYEPYFGFYTLFFIIERERSFYISQPIYIQITHYYYKLPEKLDGGHDHLWSYTLSAHGGTTTKYTNKSRSFG